VSKSKIIILLAVTILLCTPGVYPQYASAADQKGPVTVASKIDTEGALLGQMIMLMLRDSGFEVKDKTGIRPDRPDPEGHHQRRDRHLSRIHGEWGILLQQYRSRRMEGCLEGV